MSASSKLQLQKLWRWPLHRQVGIHESLNIRQGDASVAVLIGPLLRESFLGLAQGLELRIQAGSQGVNREFTQVTGTAIRALGSWTSEVLQEPQHSTWL